MKRHITIWLFLLLLGNGCQGEKCVVAQRGVFTWRTGCLSEKDYLPVAGEWEFYKDTFIAPEAFANNATPLMQAYVQAPGRWCDLGKERPKNGIATYRMVIKANDTLPKILGIAIRQGVSAYRLFINGVLVLSDGKIGHDIWSHVVGMSFPVQPFIAGTTSLDMVIHMASPPHPCLGLGELFVGDFRALRRAKARRTGFLFFVIGCITIVIVYHGVILLFFRRDMASVYFLLAGISVLVFLSSSFYENILLLFYPDVPYVVYAAITSAAGFVAIVLLALFAHELFPREFPQKVVLGISMLVAAVAVIMLKKEVVFSNFGVWLSSAVKMTCGIYAIIALVVAALRKRRGSVLFLIGYGTLGIAANVDAYISLTGIPSSVLTPLGFLVLILCQAAALAQRYAASVKQTIRQQMQLAQSEKLATIGTLTASVAHEINNPNNALSLSLKSQQQAWREIEPVLDRYAEEQGGGSK